MDLAMLDLIMLLLVGGGAIVGGFRGFVTEMLSLFAWVAAVLAIKFFFDPVAGWLGGADGPSATSFVLAFVILFLGTFMIGKLLARSLGRRTRQSVLGPLDRLLGFGFGGLKGLIGATLLFLLASLVHDTIHGAAAPRPEWMRESRAYPLLNATGGAVVGWMAARRARPADSEDAGDSRGEGEGRRRPTETRR